jgi:hypothetical protein
MDDDHRPRSLGTGGPGHAGPMLLGAGGPPPLSDILNTARSVTGERLYVTSAPAQTGEMPTVMAGFSLDRFTGSHPQHDLKSGLATGWPAFAEAAQ